MAYPYSVSSPYGARRGDPDGVHQGIDFATPYGTPIYAPRDGTLVQFAFHPIYGMRVGLSWGAYLVFGAHLSETHGRDGARVEAGTLIGATGNSGRSSGPHLHFEARLNGRHIPPEPYIGLLFGEEYEMTEEQDRMLRAVYRALFDPEFRRQPDGATPSPSYLSIMDDREARRRDEILAAIEASDG